ncbi:peptide transporter ptr2 [Sporothrix curviconia]|uniref:Peptide transporter ptr2 n=1 Tax=Sporothrix curviconia TaxID=1260050 RepID=A0ABP0C5L7_9PEZI
MEANIDTVASGPAKEHGVAQVFSGVALVESEKVGSTEARVAQEDVGGADDYLPQGSAEYPVPTAEESSTLRRVAGSIPVASYILCVAELAERASYFGASTVFSNFMEFPLPDRETATGAVRKGDSEGHAGALGKGLQFATAFQLLFTFLAYVFPILGAWIADVRLGRFKTIMLGAILGGVAHVIMIGGAAPAVLRAGRGVAPFLVSLFLLVVGAGIFKPNVAPLLIDQYQHQHAYVKTLPLSPSLPSSAGEKVIVDPERTIQRILLIFYAMINIGSFFAIATTYTEKYVGFWVSFLLPGIVYFLLPALLLAVYKRLRGVWLGAHQLPQDCLDGRMTFGFLLAAASGVIGAIVQWRVYATSPCGYSASTCADLVGVGAVSVSPLSIWWQFPNIALGAVSELFCNVTAYEMAYVRAPPQLKSVVMAIFLFTNALSNALGEILVPAIVDPHLVWVWAGPAMALFAQTAVFYYRHHQLDDEIYMLEQNPVGSLLGAPHAAVDVAEDDKAKTGAEVDLGA